MSPAGAINAWVCDQCHVPLVAVHIDDGVTPMFLACRATIGCRGKMVSSGYPRGDVPAHILDRLAWEWHAASSTQLKQWKRDRDPMYEHAMLGGLVLRWLTDAGRAAAGATP